MFSCRYTVPSAELGLISREDARIQRIMPGRALNRMINMKERYIDANWAIIAIKWTNGSTFVCDVSLSLTLVRLSGLLKLNFRSSLQTKSQIHMSTIILS